MCSSIWHWIVGLDLYKAKVAAVAVGLYLCLTLGMTAIDYYLHLLFPYRWSGSFFFLCNGVSLFCMEPCRQYMKSKFKNNSETLKFLSRDIMQPHCALASMFWLDLEATLANLFWLACNVATALCSSVSKGVISFTPWPFVLQSNIQ